MKRAGAYLLLAIAGMAVWFLMYNGGEGGLSQFGAAEESPPLSWWLTAGCGYFVMLVGAVLGVACRIIIERRAKGADTVDVTLFRATFQHADFWLSMLASPLLYGTVLQTGAELPQGPFIFFALQSGFSAYVIVNSLLGAKGTVTLPKPPRS